MWVRPLPHYTQKSVPSILNIKDKTINILDDKHRRISLGLWGAKSCSTEQKITNPIGKDWETRPL